jgi:hypothetical protein
MHGIYTYIPETNHVPREQRVAAILVLLFLVRISLVPVLTPLYLYVSTFRRMCAVPNMAVFCSSLTLLFSGMLLKNFLNDFEMVPVAPIITGITFFTFHMRCISVFIIISIIIVVVIIIIIPPARCVSSAFVNLNFYVNKLKFLFLLFFTNMLEGVLSERYAGFLRVLFLLSR